MKRLFKQVCKYYFCLTLFIILVDLYICQSEMTSLGCHELMEEPEWQVVHIYECVELVSDSIVDVFLSYIVETIVIFLLVQKGIRYWIEKDRYGSEFLETLPVKKVERKVFYILMDGLQILISLTAVCIYIFQYSKGMLEMVEIEVPWLAKSIFGMGITMFSYLFFLLGCVYLIENIFINGFMKLFGILSGFWMASSILYNLAYLNGKSNKLSNILDFLTVNVVWNLGKEWEQNIMTQDIFYKGDLLDYSLLNRVEWIDDYFAYSKIGLFYDLSKIECYLKLGLIYLLLGIALAVLSVLLAKKQELSKDAFYFSFGRYLYSALIAVTVFFMLYVNAFSNWHKCFILLAAITVFVVLLYLLNPKKKKQAAA